MKIVTYTNKEGADLGLLLNDKIYSLKAIANTMNAFLQMGDTAMQKVKSVEESIKNGSSKASATLEKFNTSSSSV